MKNPLIAFLIALFISYFLTPIVRRLAISKGVLVMPSERRVHKEPTPLWGGLAIYIAVVIASGAIYIWGGIWDKEWQCLGLVGMGGLVVIMGALDDKYQFSALVQMAFLLIMGSAVQLFGVQIQGITNPTAGPSPNYDPNYAWLALNWLAAPVTALWMFVISKTMDTIDGLDGLAAGIGAIAAATIVFMSIGTRQPEVAVVAASTCGAALGFLRHNYNPAKIFMGTGGAQFLGFVLAGLAIIGTYKIITIVVMGVSLLVFGLPIFDAFFVVFRRIKSGSPIYKADKRHIHHQLLEKGFTQRQAVLVLYAFAFLLSATAIILFSIARSR